jgi:ApaG protein
MVSLTSEGIKISVETFYQKDYSNPLNDEYMFAYKVTIYNMNSFPVRLNKRHWDIFDSTASEHRIVEGEGVIGMIPVINPKATYEYISGTNIHSDIGSMVGSYEMENLDNKQRFAVDIPKFDLFAPFKYN